MSIKDATPEEIDALRQRIYRRQSDRRYEMQMDEVVAMVCKANRRPFCPRKSKTPPLESVIAAVGTMAVAGAAAILGNLDIVPIGYAAAVTGVAVAGVFTRVSREVQE